jgi:protein-tyrosine phosphatase
MAEGVLRNMAHRKGLSIEVDSAGTANYHVGEAPDPRAISCMSEYNIDISELRGRQFTKADFQSYDHILVMDQSNLRNVLALTHDEEHRNKVELLLAYSPSSDQREVPDPWYGDRKDFHHVYGLLTEALESFIITHQLKKLS